jgi:hypothetical protein
MDVIMELIKKSGRREPFQIEKVQNSITAACDEAGCLLTAGELKRLAAEVGEIVSGKPSVTSKEISTVVAGVLYVNGLRDVLDKSLNYKEREFRALRDEAAKQLRFEPVIELRKNAIYCKKRKGASSCQKYSGNPARCSRRFRRHSSPAAAWSARMR